MLTLRLAAVTLVAATATGTAFTQDSRDMTREIWRRHSPEYHSCTKRASGHLQAIFECEAEEFELQDARLNRAYKKAINLLAAHREAKLRTAQRSWIRRRDPTCEREAVKQDGSNHSWMYSYLYWSCVKDATIRRTILIERYAAGQASLADLARDHRS